MDHQDVQKLFEFSQEKMKKTGVFNTAHLFCDVYCFEPGQVQKPHTHDDSDKVYYVLQGKGIFHIGGEEKELSENHITLAPAGIEHGVSNRSGEQLILLVMMAPNTKHSH